MEVTSGLSERVLELGKKSWLHLRAFLWKEKVQIESEWGEWKKQPKIHCNDFKSQNPACQL